MTGFSLAIRSDDSACFKRRYMAGIAGSYRLQYSEQQNHHLAGEIPALRRQFCAFKTVESFPELRVGFMMVLFF